MVLAILLPHWLAFFPIRIQQFTAVTGCEVSRVHQTSDVRRKFEAHVRASIDVITHGRPDHSMGAVNYFTIIIQTTIPHRLNLISPLAPPPPDFNVGPKWLQAFQEKTDPYLTLKSGARGLICKPGFEPGREIKFSRGLSN